MKKSSSVIWGIIIIVVGLLLLGNNTKIIDFDLFFKGWWTLFIIVPSIIGLFKKETIISSIVGITIGTLLLLASQGIIDWSMTGKIFIPILLIIIGLSCIFKTNKMRNIITNKNGVKEYIGIFSGAEERVVGEFNGANCIAVFGAVELDLTKADIKEDIKIECVTVFGGIDIKVPDDVNVKISGVPIFGGAENKATQNTTKDSKTIYINYVCAFAGMDVK